MRRIPTIAFAAVIGFMTPLFALAADVAHS